LARQKTRPNGRHVKSCRTILLAAAGTVLLSGCGAPAPQTSIPAPPETRRDDAVDIFHGIEIIDSYRWLEDQESPETRDWLDAQNA